MVQTGDQMKRFIEWQYDGYRHPVHAGPSNGDSSRSATGRGRPPKRRQDHHPRGLSVRRSPLWRGQHGKASGSSRKRCRRFARCDRMWEAASVSFAVACRPCGTFAVTGHSRPDAPSGAGMFGLERQTGVCVSRLDGRSPSRSSAMGDNGAELPPVSPVRICRPMKQHWNKARQAEARRSRSDHAGARTQSRAYLKQEPVSGRHRSRQ